ncbi:hypothetical protein BGZ73_004431 [Actinomortierella ambigua]|nr:hypothetical protein BGZ73_004431 [Actinomortierella ambigua]
MNKLDIPLQFVQLHQKRFKGTLKDIVVRGSDASWSPLDHLLCHVDPMRLVDLSAWNSPLPTFEQLPISELQLKRLEEIRLRGTPWQLDTDTILEIGQGLSQTLRHLDIMDSMHPTTTGLAKLTHVAVRLEILKLGVPYLQVKTRLLAMARPNVKIVFSMEQ